MTVRRRKIPRTRSRRKRLSPRAEETGGWKIFDWFAIILGGIVLLVGGISALVGPESSRTKRTGPVSGEKVVLQLFNGTGDKTAIAPLSDSLRAMGIDIRDEVRGSRSVYPYTILLDRHGNPKLVDSLATLLGMPHDRIVLQRNRDIYDATLVIGKDYKQILTKIFSKK
ncbi:LytR C-terminal domain-containing protein [bacterium]|nr:LytR C-terminal domain-containing protein [bacterium]